MSAYPDGPQGFGSVLDTSFRLYRASFGRSVALALISTFLVIAPMVLIGIMMFRSMGSPDGGSGMIVAGILFVVGFIASIGVSLGIIHQVDATGQDLPDRTLGDSIARGFRRLLPMIWTMIVWYVALIGSAIPAVVAAMVLIDISPVVGGLVTVVLGLLPFVMMIYLILAFVLTVTDGESGITAVRHSYSLVKGNWWRVFLIVTVITIIYMVFGIIIMLLSGLIAGMLGLAGQMGGAMSMAMGGMVGMVGNLVSMILQAILLPFLIAGFLAIQHDLKLRKEGSDLEERLAG